MGSSFIAPSTEDGIALALIIGIIVAVVLLIAGVIVLVLCICKHKRAKARRRAKVGVHHKMVADDTQKMPIAMNITQHEPQPYETQNYQVLQKQQPHPSV